MAKSLSYLTHWVNSIIEINSIGEFISITIFDDIISNRIKSIFRWRSISWFFKWLIHLILITLISIKTPIIAPFSKNIRKLIINVVIERNTICNITSTTLTIIIIKSFCFMIKSYTIISCSFNTCTCSWVSTPSAIAGTLR